MAEEQNDTEINFRLTAQNDAVREFQLVERWLADQVHRFAEAGRSESESLAMVVQKLRELREAGRLTDETYKKIFSKSVDESGLGRLGKVAFKIGEFLGPRQGDQEMVQSFNRMVMSAGRAWVAVRALQQPFRELIGFANGLTRLNVELEKMALRSGSTAGRVAAEGAALRQFGGDAREAAGFKGSFESAMEARRVGLGNGGPFMQALMRYGIQFDPNDYNRTMENYAAWFSDPRRTSAQKLQAQRMLGLSDAQRLQLEGGVQAYRDSQTRYNKWTSHSEEAAGEALKLTKATGDLKTAWGDLYNSVFTDVAPILTKIAGQLAEFVRDNGPLAKVLIYLWGLGKAAMLIAPFVNALALIRIAFGQATAHILSSSAKIAAATAASSAAGVASSGAALAAGAAPSLQQAVLATRAGARLAPAAAQTAGTLAATAGGQAAAQAAGMAASGMVGVVAGVVNAVAGVGNAIAGGIQRHNTNLMLEEINAAIVGWADEWRASARGGGTNGDFAEMLSVVRSFKSVVTEFYDGIRDGKMNFGGAGGVTVSIERIEVVAGAPTQGGELPADADIEARVRRSVETAFQGLLD